MTTTGKGILVFENLSAGKYTVTVNYTTPVGGVSEVKIEELSVYAVNLASLLDCFAS